VGGHRRLYIPAVTPFTVRVAKEALGFSAAHFLALPGHVCERLHGHNYRVAVSVEGRVDGETGFVVDFAVVKRAVRAIIEPLDHRVLLPALSRQVTIHDTGESTVVDYMRPGWMVVPSTHARVVPVAHTTAELLADWLARELWDRLEGEGCLMDRMVLELEESAGQSASVVRTRAG